MKPAWPLRCEFSVQQRGGNVRAGAWGGGGVSPELEWALSAQLRWRVTRAAKLMLTWAQRDPLWQ